MGINNNMNNLDILNYTLSGFEALDEDSRVSFISENVKAGVLPENWTWDNVNKLYRNKQYIDTFGIEAFKNNADFDARDQEFRAKIIGDAIKSQYANDPNLEGILKMTTEGQLELLNNNKYNTQESIDKAFENAKNHQIYIPTSTGVGMYQTVDKSEETKADLLNQNNEVLNSIYTKDLERKKQSLSPIIDATEQMLYEKINIGELTLKEIKEHFDEITQGTHYEQLKNSTTFKDYSDANLIRDYATFIAMQNGIDGVTAYQTLRADMQNYTNEHMPFMDFTDAKLTSLGPTANFIMRLMPNKYKDENPTILNNAKRDVLTTAGAYFGKVPVAVEGIIKSLYKDDGEAKDLFLKGLDADGNPLPTWRNPLYWQGVEQYNTWDENKIAHLQETGGVSPYVNVPQAGDELEFWNGINILNSVTQFAGQALPMVGTAILSGGAATAAKTVGSVASKIGWGFLNASTTAAELGIPALTMSHGEAYEVYQNTNLAIQQEIDAKIDDAVKAEMNRLYNSEEGKQDIQKIKDLLISQAAEQGQFYPDEDYLNELAEQKYLESIQHTLNLKYEKEFNDREKEGREEAARIAYNNTFGIHAFKNIVFDIALNRVFMSKGTRDFFSDNSLLKFKPQEYIDEAGNKAVKELSRSKKFANALIEGGQQFADEWSDAAVNSLGENIGLSDYNDFVKKTYNQEAYVEVMDNWFNHFLMGLNDLPDDLFTREALYEGWAGLISSFTPGINPDAFTSIGRGTSFRTDQYGNKLSFMESVNKYMTSPLLGAYYEYNPQERAVKSRLNIAAQVLSNNRDKLEVISQLMTASGNTDGSASTKSLRETMNAKYQETVNTAMLLEELNDEELTGLRKEFQDADGLAQSIIDDTISEEEKNKLIDSYLNRADNKSVADSTPEEAWAQIQDNAKKFSDIRNTIKTKKAELNKNKDTKNLSDNAKNQLIYLTLLDDNYKTRIQKMSEELGVTSDSSKERTALVTGNDEVLYVQMGILAERIASNKEDIWTVNEKLKEAKIQYKGAIRKEDKANLADKIKALEIEKRALEAEEKELLMEKKKFDGIQETFNLSEGTGTLYANKALSQEEILALHPIDRAIMLDTKNIGRYSIEQQQIILQTRIALNQKDINALEKINDISELSQQLKDNEESYSRMIEDPEALELYERKKRERYKSAIEKAKIQSDVKYLTSLMDNAKTDEERINIVKSKSVPVVEAYIEAYPEYKPLLEPILPLVKMYEDTKDIIGKLFPDSDGNSKRVLRARLGDLTSKINNESRTPEEVMSKLESVIDNPYYPIEFRDAVEKYIEAVERRGYQRDATKIQSREEKKAQKEAEDKRREEERLKQEEIKKKEEEFKKQAEEKAKSEENPVPDRDDYNSETSSDEISIDGENFEEPSIETTETVEETSIEDNHNPNNTLTIDEEISRDKDAVIITPTVEYSETTENNPLTYKGNISDWNYEALKLEGRQERWEGEKEGDSRHKVLEWLDSMNIHFQDIIDHELTRIMNTGANIQFMMVSHKSDITGDKTVQDYLFEVVEYNDKVKKIHPEDKGSIITANNKQWLVIGIANFDAKNNLQKKSFGNMQYEIKKQRQKHITENPGERFFVSDTYKTKVSHINKGFITRALQGEEASTRTIGELLEGDRNPRNLDMEDLKWAVVLSNGRIHPIGISDSSKISFPSNLLGREGEVFLMIEAADGKYIPAYIQPVSYKSMKEGTLKSKIDNLINELSAPKLEDRLAAKEQLQKLLVMNNKNNIEIDKNSGIISIREEGQIVKTFNLDDQAFNRLELVDAVQSLNLRINIDKDLLSNTRRLQEYDEAGVLLIDIAKLGTSGATYSVYAMDDKGNPIIPKEPSVKTTDESSKIQHKVKHANIKYTEVNGEFFRGNQKVTDPLTIEQLRLLQQVEGLNPIETTNEYKYYILSNDEKNPIVVAVDSNNVITKVTKQQALNKIKEMQDRIIAEKQKEALKQIEAKEETPQNAYDAVVNPKQEVEEEIQEEVNPEIKESIIQETKNTFTINDIYEHSTYGDILDSIIDEKIESGAWEDSEGLLNSLEGTKKYLENKGISTIGIQDMKTWCDMVKNCK